MPRTTYVPRAQITVTAHGLEREIAIPRGARMRDVAAVLLEMPEDAEVIDGYPASDIERGSAVVVVFRVPDAPIADPDAAGEGRPGAHG
jgi:hypothetical protein